MFGPTTAISVSVSNGYDYVKGEDRHYMKPQHTWMLSVACHKGRLLLGVKDPGPKHYSANWDSSRNQYKVECIEKLNLGIVGNILITNRGDARPEKIARLLDESLQKDGGSLPWNPDVSEQWIRMALRELQTFKIIPQFDVDEFMTLAHGYLAKRVNSASGGSAPAVMPFDKLVKQHIKKPEGKRFWLSYPSAKTNKNGDKLYGGLM